MKFFMVMFADLDEYGIGLELRDGEFHLVGAEDVQPNDLMTAVVAFGNAFGNKTDLAIPLYGSVAFQQWFEGSKLTGIDFGPLRAVQPIRITWFRARAGA